MWIKQMWALIIFYIKGYFLRKPISFLNLFGQTLGIILILTLIGGKNYFPRALYGSLIAIAVGSGIGQYAPDICALYTSKFKDVYVVTNIKSHIFMVASAIGITFLYLLQAAILMIVLIIIFHLSFIQSLLVLAIFLIAWSSFISLGFYLSLKIKYVVDLMKLTGLLMLIFTYFSPVYYLEGIIPKPYRYIFYLSPTTHISALFNYVIYGYSGDVALHIILFILFTLLFLYLGVRKAKWME